MVDIDQAMAELDSPKTAVNSEPAAPKAEQPAAEQATAPAGETNSSGSATPETKAPEAKEEAKQEEKVPKSQYAWAKLNKKLKENRSDLEKVLKAIEELSGVKYDPKNGNLEDYINLRLKRDRLEARRDALNDDPEVSRMWENLRDYQAKELFADGDYKKYMDVVAPKRMALYKEIREKDPTGAVITHLQSSKYAPLLETAFVMKGGLEVFNSILSDDEYQTRRNLEELENKIKGTLKARPAEVQTPKAKQVTTPSVNDGNAVTNTKTTPSLADVEKWF